MSNANPCIRRLHAARQRCRNPNDKKFKYYGARGVKCLISAAEIEMLWKRDKASEMKSPSLDRIDPLGNYEVSNCRFIEAAENTRRALIGTTMISKKSSIKRCGFCGVTMRVPFSLQRRGQGRYCSMACKSQAYAAGQAAARKRKGG